MSAEYAKLKGKIVERFGSQRAFAQHLGVTEQTVTAKLAGRSAFSQDDIISWSNALGIEAREIGLFYFARKL